MNVTYSDKAKESSWDFAALQKATAYLEEIASVSAPRVTASWDRLDEGR